MYIMFYKILFLLTGLWVSLLADAHSGKPRTYVIIDTDCAADDLRAICMLLGDHDIEVMAVTTSEGALTPQEGKQKVEALLHSFYHQGIPVAAGRSVDAPAPRWRSIAQQVTWGKPVSGTATDLSAKDLMLQAIGQEKRPVTLLCLGPLTNVSDLLTEKPDIKERIARVVWYNSGQQPIKGVNYETDPVAAKHVMESGVPMVLVSALKEESAPLDRQFLTELARMQSSTYARKVAQTHSTPPLRELVRDEHLRLWDELVVLAISAPQLFNKTVLSPTVEWYSINTAQDILPIEEQLLTIYRGPENVDGKVFYHFPLDEGYYIRDIMPIIGRAVQRYGLSEFRAAVLTNELHGHLGIYATVGVKMGIRAREYFNIGVDDMQVITYAGSQPPVSCLNDGLQVSTGGTLGHGLITVADIPKPEIRPEATFNFKGKQVTIRMKPEYAQRVREDLRKGIEMYGADTEANWQYVRQLAVQYWLDWDRHDIFDILPQNISTYATKK